MMRCYVWHVTDVTDDRGISTPSYTEGKGGDASRSSDASAEEKKCVTYKEKVAQNIGSRCSVLKKFQILVRTLFCLLVLKVTQQRCISQRKWEGIPFIYKRW